MPARSSTWPNCSGEMRLALCHVGEGGVDVRVGALRSHRPWRLRDLELSSISSLMTSWRGGGLWVHDADQAWCAARCRSSVIGEPLTMTTTWRAGDAGAAKATSERGSDRRRPPAEFQSSSTSTSQCPVPLTVRMHLPVGAVCLTGPPTAPTPWLTAVPPSVRKLNCSMIVWLSAGTPLP